MDQYPHAHDWENAEECSVEPTYPTDSTLDLLSDALLESGASKHVVDAFRKKASAILDEAIEYHGNDNPQSTVTEVLTFIDNLPNPGIGVWCVLSLLGKREDSETDTGNRYGVTRASVSKIMTIVRDHFGLPLRAGRPDSTREKNASRRFEKQHQPKPTWKFQHLASTILCKTTTH